MKPVMDWMKANLAIVILSVLILLVLPAAFVGSSYWNNRIKRKREAEANSALSQLKALDISYNIPPALTGGTPVTYASSAPNPTATNFFKQHRDQLEAQVAEVAGVAKTINQNGHKLLVEGLFIPPPAATGAETPSATPGALPPGPTQVDPLKALELSDLIIGRGDKPSVYQGLLDKMNAGGPADPVKIAEQLRNMETQFRDAVKAQSNRTQLTAEEQTELTKKLVEARIGQYQQQARKISVYATRDVLPRDIPRQPPSETPDAMTCYTWNYDYWVVSDLLAAIDAANTTSGQRSTLDQSVVKRIENIGLDPATDPNETSVTGRKSGGENKLYDVRDATLNLVVASARVPELINAISRTNFMTVIGLDLKEVDPWADLDQGYYYGPEHVVKATLRVETIWLRSWTEPLMPQPFRDAVMGTAASPDAAAAPAPAAPTTTRGKGQPDESRVRGTAPRRRDGGGG